MSLKTVLVRLDAELDAVTRAREHSETAFRRGKGPRGSLKNALASVSKREPLLRDAIDKACLEWIAGRPWPKMNSDDAYLVWERLFEASSFGSLLSARGFQAVRRTDAQILNFLLVEHWARYGHVRLKARVDDLRD